MLIDTKTGKIEIDKDLIIDGNYTLEDFKKTKYYKKENKSNYIILEGEKIIANHKFLISLFFRFNKIYIVGLSCEDKEISFENEPKRKLLHDEILKEENIDKRGYSWGGVYSRYDPRGNSSSIDIEYFNEFDL